MLFPTITFAIFFLVVFTASWLTMPHPRVWRWVMLASSYFFYGWWDWRFVPLLAGSTIVNQMLAVAIHRSSDERSRRWLLGAAVAANLGVLSLFKYYGFFVSSVLNVLREMGIEASAPALHLVLPLGISFFTFQAMSYVIDVYRRSAQPVHPLDFAVYLSFFPQLVAGPIVRTGQLIPQFASPRDPRRIDASRAFRLIAAGVVKKVIIADYLARSIVDPVFHSPGQHTSLEVLAAIYAFAIQIFCDFSAYVDIALGVAILLGFKLPENFNRPYSATSIQDFWRRWHMTLSSWLRDYLYVPLGGSRGGRASTYRNLMLTMLLGGLWHGAAWKFVLWGGLHGAWLSGGRWREERRSRTPHTPALTPRLDPKGISTLDVELEPRATRLRRQVVTFHLVALAWIPFRADSMGHVWEVLGRLLTAWGPAPAVTPAVVATILAGLLLHSMPDGWLDRIESSFSRLPPLGQGAVLAAFLVAVDALGPEGVAAFIYFQF